MYKYRHQVDVYIHIYLQQAQHSSCGTWATPMAPASQHIEGGHHLCVFLCENQIRVLWSQSYTLRETDVTQPSVSVVCLRGCCVLVMACKLNHMPTEVSGALHAPHLLLRAISCCGV